MSGAVLSSQFLTRLLASIKCVSVLEEDISRTADSVDFVHICYIQCDLFDCYIFYQEIMPATLANSLVHFTR